MHPNDHVNMAQSTNDVIPTAMRARDPGSPARCSPQLDVLAESLLAKGVEFDHIIKSGRTHLQDATPIRLGQEFAAYGRTVARHREKITRAAEWLRELNIGGTAVGTGLNAEPQYPELMWKYLEEVSGLDLRVGEDRIQFDAVHGRHRHLQRRGAGVRRSTSTRSRTTSACWRPGPRTGSGRDHPPRGAARVRASCRGR